MSFGDNNNSGQKYSAYAAAYNQTNGPAYGYSNGSYTQASPSAQLPAYGTPEYGASGPYGVYTQAGYGAATQPPNGPPPNPARPNSWGGAPSGFPPPSSSNSHLALGFQPPPSGLPNLQNRPPGAWHARPPPGANYSVVPADPAKRKGKIRTEMFSRKVFKTDHTKYHVYGEDGYEARTIHFGPARNRPPRAEVGDWACLQLSGKDKLRLLNFPPEVVEGVRRTLKEAWEKGMSKDKDYAKWGNGVQVHEFGMSGGCWNESLNARRLMCRLIKDLGRGGFHLAATSDITKKLHDKDSLFFRRGVPVDRPVFCVTFEEDDKIRLIDWPNERVFHAFVEAAHGYPGGITYASEKDARCYQFKLNGMPWNSHTGEVTTHARILALALLSQFERAGFEFVGSIDMNPGEEEKADVDGSAPEAVQALQALAPDEGHSDAWFFAEKAS